jgi:CRP-like cAMP-binding protein
VSELKNAGLGLFVDRLTARSVLSPEEQQAIVSLPARLAEFKPRHDIVRLGETSAYCSFVVSGLVGRFNQMMNGARQITAFYIPGDAADLDSAVRPIGVDGLNALCQSTILSVPHAAIRTLAARYPAVAEALWRDCLLDAAIRTQWVVNVGRRDAQTRLAHNLCEMAIRSGRAGEIPLEYAFPITQEQLGDALALTPIHVNRCLKALRPLARFKSGQVQIYDWTALVRAADFNAGYLVADAAYQARGEAANDSRSTAF